MRGDFFKNILFRQRFFFPAPNFQFYDPSASFSFSNIKSGSVKYFQCCLKSTHISRWLIWGKLLCWPSKLIQSDFSDECALLLKVLVSFNPLYLYTYWNNVLYICLKNTVRWKSKGRVPKRNLKINKTKDEILPLFLAL